ncbi:MULTISPECIES: hypothetical protein [Caballeronia]|jgi:hypothetical protein|uniref:Uncharacterized protein n=1 Tax=Caballeronia zhejiangensis TaxID=871203 RepID=A0A656QR40_9BURK|nr:MULTISPECIES: hypothetical protein [Caballeronia]EKS71469.1 hypothetical protein BURK_010846 [Burkholderia sp. SJ98]KDR31924.1 hypothetical protein BG60_25040 [Caballeronia zhejiangensis]MCG7403263.1 hypothetical protein [Caballeronia zhejiangensis]MCI1044925.1 hypothetical protein [Caballeronia zhejiangensis]MDR5769491.1 hypothetical protein [Caballeronia sp. LZ028]
MGPTSLTFDIDPTPRRADGEFMAHARITMPAENGSEGQIFMSGDLAGFDTREDAIAYARIWARDWIDAFVRLNTR